jgi:hypothetical protein
MATAAEAAVNFARRRGAATTAKWQADYDAWQKRDLLLDAVVLSLQNGGGFKIPWRDDRRSASRVVSVPQTTPMRLDYETRSTVAGRRLHLRICLIGAPADLTARSDVIGLLSAIGGDTSGALSFGQPARTPSVQWRPQKASRGQICNDMKQLRGSSYNSGL